MSVSERNAYEVEAEREQRIARLERALRLLVEHVGTARYNPELQRLLEEMRDETP